jgi:soluble lytic murein transglycosylase-like protein
MPVSRNLNEDKKNTDEYWGTYRGRLHLLMAKNRITHLNFPAAKKHLILAEKYDADPAEWEKVRQYYLESRREGVRASSHELANRRYQGGMKTIEITKPGPFLTMVEKASKKGTKTPPMEWLRMVDRYSKENKLDPLLVWALIDVESSWRKDVVSSVGAQGLMQLMPMTAEELDVKNVFDPEDNIKGGTQYMRFLIEMFDDVDKALAAYNVGPGRVERTGVPPAGKRYIKKVKTRHAALQKQFNVKSSS